MLRAAAEPRAVTAGKWLLAALIPASALALGSLPVAILIVMSALAAVSCGLVWAGRAVEISRPAALVLAALALLLAMTVLQAIPVPDSLARTLSPATADIWERALAPLREAGPSWHPLSIAPSATRIEVLRGFFYGCVFLSALRVAALEHGERFLIQAVVGSTGIMAFTALAHTAVSADKVFGFYRPHESYAYLPGRMAPLLNTNHLAAYLGMGACVSLWTVLTGRAMPRALSGAMTVVLAASAVWQASRGATAALLFGVVLTFALTFYSKRRFDSARVRAAIVVACAIAAGLVVSISLSDSRTHLLSRDLVKVDIAKRSLGLIWSSPWFGFGRGGFETVFPSVHVGTSYVTFTNPEDIVIQWLVEWGVPVSVGGFGLLACALRPRTLLRAVRPAIGAWVAIVAAVLHDLVDYHFEVPGIVVLAAVCAAMVVSGRPRSEHRREVSSWRPRAGAFAVVFGTVAAVACVWPDIGHSLAEDRRRLSAAAVDKALSREQFHDEVRAAMLRHPAEPFVPLMGAVRSQIVDGGSVVPWVARSLERDPRFGRAHLVLARSLAAGGHLAQARLEYRLAYEDDENLRTHIVKEASVVVEDAPAALELVPEGPAGDELLDSLVTALGPRLPSTAVILDAELERRAPAAKGPLRRRADAAVSDIAPETAPWCQGGRCFPSALAIVERLANAEQDRCSSHVLLARLRIAKGEAIAALDALEAAMDGIGDRAQCQRQLIELSLETKQVRRCDAVLDQIVRAGCGAAADCLELYAWAAGKEEQRGHFLRAVRLYRRVIDLAPDRDDLLEHIGELGEHDGLLSDALEAYGTLQRRHPEDPRWPARIAELRSRGSRRPPERGVPAAIAP